jgi:hypothetical protein
MFAWLDSEKGNKSILAFSGEADPIIWNALEGELMSAVDRGTKYIHCLGPVVCTDENGRHGILEVYKKYPEKVELRLFRTRYPYHWICFTSINDNKLFFQFKGECYHEPLTPLRKHYFISLKSDDDPHRGLKVSYWHMKQLEYRWLRVITDKVTTIDEVPTITKSQIAMIYNKLKDRGKNLDLLTSEEILASAKKITI